MKRWLGSLLALTFGAIACADTVTTPGQLVLSFQTDMRLPEDTDSVRIVITRFGKSEFDQTYEVGGDGRVKIPATLGVVAGSNPSDPIKISLTAILNKKPQVLREIVTTIPSTRIATLRVPFQWLCYGERSITGDSVETAVNTCGEGKTCVAGSCQTQEVDSSLLPDFKEVEIFGGGTSNGDGKCFDTAAVFPASLKGTVPTLVGDTCSISKPSGDESLLNVAIRLRAGASTCPLGECVVPFDRDLEAGWSIVGSNVVLPKKACELFNAGKLDVIASLGAPSKTLSLPMCGPWSSANTSASPGVSVKDATTSSSTGDGGVTNPTDGVLVNGTPTTVDSIQLADRADGLIVYYREVSNTVRGVNASTKVPVTFLEGANVSVIRATVNHILYTSPTGIGPDAIQACSTTSLLCETSSNFGVASMTVGSPFAAAAVGNSADSQILWFDNKELYSVAASDATSGGTNIGYTTTGTPLDMVVGDAKIAWAEQNGTAYSIAIGSRPPPTGGSFSLTGTSPGASYAKGTLRIHNDAAVWLSPTGQLYKYAGDVVESVFTNISPTYAIISTGVFYAGNNDIFFQAFEGGDPIVVVGSTNASALAATEKDLVYANNSFQIVRYAHGKGAK